MFIFILLYSLNLQIIISKKIYIMHQGLKIKDIP